MAKTFVERILGFSADVHAHLMSMLHGEASIREALGGVAGCARKLAHDLRKKPVTVDRRAAQSYVNRGVQAFNARQYSKAEHLFSQGVECDPHYGRAHLYLGNTYYKSNRVIDAIGAWERAISVEPGSEAAAAAEEKLLRMKMRRTQDAQKVVDQLEMREDG